MTEEEKKKIEEKAGIAAIAKMLVSIPDKLYITEFQPKAHIDQYLKDEAAGTGLSKDQRVTLIIKLL